MPDMPLGALGRAAMEREQWEAFVRMQERAVREAQERHAAAQRRVLIQAPAPEPWRMLPDVIQANPFRIDIEEEQAADERDVPRWDEPVAAEPAKKIPKPEAKEKEMFRYRLFEMLGHRAPTAGMYGLEVEVEGAGLPREIKGFRTEHDGSLRGEENMEYIFEKPMNLKEAEAAVKLFSRTFKDEGAIVDMSYRTSVHVHVNVTQLNKLQLCTFLYLSYLLETALVNYCGPTRIGNRFCLRLVDAHDKITELESFFQVPGNHVYDAQKGKYSAINMAPMRSQGSVEFRSMKGTVDHKEINTWLRLIDCVYRVSQEFANPEAIATYYHDNGPRALAQRVFGEQFKNIEYDHLEDDIRMNFSLLISLPFEEIKDFV